MDFGTLELNSESVIVQRSERENLRVLNEDSLTVALDPEITDELRREGLIRDVVRSVQNLRKELDFSVTDRITLIIDGSTELADAVQEYHDYLAEETLASSIEIGTNQDSVSVDIGAEKVSILVRKV
jgi:isoleucyl-tRNA synthetase